MRTVFGLVLLSSSMACGGTVITRGGDDSGVTGDVDPTDTGTDAPTTVHPVRVDKLDLLFVVDNSISMADKQLELARRIPDLIATLTSDSEKRITDIHVGMITSSLGSHGTDACPITFSAHVNDHGHLLPRAGESAKSGFTVDGPAPCPGGIASSSAIGWTFAGGGTFSGEAGAKQFEIATSCLAQGVGEDGCGYEETWEALYHFLVDPKPYATAEVKCGGSGCGSNKLEPSGVDSTLLAQRAAFLRPDSLLGIVILSDENDVSLKPAGLNWLPWQYPSNTFQRGWAKCASVPDDFEPESAAEFNALHSMYGCKSCFEDNSDPDCSRPWSTADFNVDTDNRNLRGFEQTRRFGYNFLWGRDRYVRAFTSPTITGSDGTFSANPIFAGGKRTSDSILVAAIVGVPQHLVFDAGGIPLPLSASDWDKIIGPAGSRDPHMIESIAPRAGIPKFTGDRTVDRVNGGDRDVLAGDDLQYACIAQRTTLALGNECSGPDADKTNPLCDPGTQPYFKAYPGLRHLRIIHDLGTSGFAASICNASFAPAIRGIARNLLSRIAK